LQPYESPRRPQSVFLETKKKSGNRWDYYGDQQDHQHRKQEQQSRIMLFSSKSLIHEPNPISLFFLLGCTIGFTTSQLAGPKGEGRNKEVSLHFEFCRLILSLKHYK
jgi:hypothetical protein